MALHADQVDKIITGSIVRLEQEIPVLEVILFGSYAAGNPQAHSDIDLAVISRRKTWGQFFISGARCFQAPIICHLGLFSLRVKMPLRKVAISLSVALKRSERSFGTTTDSNVSSFAEVSARV
jgi:hypothetical protein